MGFSGSVNGTTKNQVFWILVFANVNGPHTRFLEEYQDYYVLKTHYICNVELYHTVGLHVFIVILNSEWQK